MRAHAMARLRTEHQVSAGGVVFRDRQVAIIAVPGDRWQLPKGLVEEGEDPAVTAKREVREETGLEAELVSPLDTIEYWYVSKREGVRYHKRVHFYLFRFLAGDVADHDDEVLEARWVDIEDAAAMLSFENEKRILELAAEQIEQADDA